MSGYETSKSVTRRLADVTVVLPVKNEERNLADALASVKWAARVVIVDSRSTDRTGVIAEEAGVEVVQFDYEPGGPKKKTWLLSTLAFATEWVLMLDADERVPEALRDEIIEATRAGKADGYFIDRELVFMGRKLRCYGHNWNMRLFRAGCGAMEDFGLSDVPGTGDNEIHENIVVEGHVDRLPTPLLHHDFRGLSPWIDRHNRYSNWEVDLYRRFRSEPFLADLVRLPTLDPVQQRRALRRLWVRLPFRPVIRFFVWYVVRLGFTDGYPGFVFCVLMGWYEFIIGAKLHERRSLDMREVTP